MNLARLAAYLLALALGLALGWLTGSAPTSSRPDAAELHADEPAQQETTRRPAPEPAGGSPEQDARHGRAESLRADRGLRRPGSGAAHQRGSLSFDDLPPSMRPEALHEALAGLDELLAEGDSELGFFGLDCDRPPCVLIFDRPYDLATYGRGQGVEDLRAALGGTASLTELQLFESRVVRDQENLFHLLIVATGEVVGERGVMDKAARLRFEEIASELVPKP
jgi:hypothetical protein